MSSLEQLHNANGITTMRQPSFSKPVFPCLECNYSTFNEAQFQHHEKKHKIKEKRVNFFQCTECEYCAMTQQDITTHVMGHQIHLKRKLIEMQAQFPCSEHTPRKEISSRVSSTVNDTTKDIDAKGNKFTKAIKTPKNKGRVREKKHSCPVCHYRTHNTYTLSDHMRVHTGEKPYLCPHCVFRCALKSNLTQHIIRKHGKDKADIVVKKVSTNKSKEVISSSPTTSSNKRIKTC